jgi:hypothetical protein
VELPALVESDSKDCEENVWPSKEPARYGAGAALERLVVGIGLSQRPVRARSLCGGAGRLNEMTEAVVDERKADAREAEGYSEREEGWVVARTAVERPNNVLNTVDGWMGELDGWG